MNEPLRPPVRIGAIGCGNVLGAYAALARRLEPSAELVIACGRPHQRAFVEGLRVPHFVTDEQAVLDSDVDIVLIITPTPTHAALANRALRAGKHVLLEKPLATTMDEGRALVALAAESRGHLLCAPFTALSPSFAALAGRLLAGQVGRVVSARGRYGWAGPDWHDWFYKKGGGALLDLGMYPITTLTALLGPACRVQAMTGIAVPTRVIKNQPVTVEAEDNAQILIEFKSGAIGAVTTGFTMQQYRSPAIELYGTEGTLQLLGDDWDPDGYEIFRRDVGAWQVHKESDPEWPWTDGLRHLVECLREGRTPILRPDFSLHVLEIALMAAAAGADGRARTLSTSFAPLQISADASHEPVHMVHDRARRSGGSTHGA